MRGSKRLEEKVGHYPDFPQKGVLFRDINPLLRDHLAELITQMEALFTEDEWQRAEYIAGIEARGFTLAAALAAKRGKGMIPIRKGGKLPGKTASIRYGLEYGQDMLEMQYGKGYIIIVDDVVATGGTMHAAASLACETGYTIIGFGTVINLASLNQFSWQGMRVRSLIQYK